MTRKSVNPINARQGTSGPKLRILAAGLTCRQVAAAAGISRSALSHHVAGRRQAAATRERVLAAFNALTGRDVTYRRFWGNTRMVKK